MWIAPEQLVWLPVLHLLIHNTYPLSSLGQRRIIIELKCVLAQNLGFFSLNLQNVQSGKLSLLQNHFPNYEFGVKRVPNDLNGSKTALNWPVYFCCEAIYRHASLFTLLIHMVSKLQPFSIIEILNLNVKNRA